MKEDFNLQIHELFEQHTSSKLINLVKNNIFIYDHNADCYVFEPSVYQTLINDTDMHKVNKVIQHRSEMLNRLNMIYNSFVDGFKLSSDLGYRKGYEVGCTIGYGIGYEDGYQNGFSNGCDWSE